MSNGLDSPVFNQTSIPYFLRIEALGGTKSECLLKTPEFGANKPPWITGGDALGVVEQKRT